MERTSITNAVYISLVTSQRAVYSARAFLKVEQRKQVQDGLLVSEKFTDRLERHEIDT